MDVDSNLKCLVKTQSDCSRYECRIKCNENEELIISLIFYRSNPPLDEWTDIKWSIETIKENLGFEIIISNVVIKNTR